MRPKTGFKLAVDLLMTLALFFLMGYQFWGEIAHEWAGTGMFVLFLLHHLLNRNWYHSLFKGKYSALRILWLTVDLAVFCRDALPDVQRHPALRPCFCLSSGERQSFSGPTDAYDLLLLGISPDESSPRASLGFTRLLGKTSVWNQIKIPRTQRWIYSYWSGNYPLRHIRLCAQKSAALPSDTDAVCLSGFWGIQNCLLSGLSGDGRRLHLFVPFHRKTAAKKRNDKMHCFDFLATALPIIYLLFLEALIL